MNTMDSYLYPRQLDVSLLVGLLLLFFIVRLIQKGSMDIAYCWLWLGVGLGMILIVLRYDWLLQLSHLIGAVLPTTTIFLIGFLVVLLMSLQFSLVISAHRRQIKRLTQHIALLEQRHAEGRAISDAAAEPGTAQRP